MENSEDMQGCATQERHEGNQDKSPPHITHPDAMADQVPQTLQMLLMPQIASNRESEHTAVPQVPERTHESSHITHSDSSIPEHTSSKVLPVPLTSSNQGSEHRIVAVPNAPKETVSPIPYESPPHITHSLSSHAITAQTSPKALPMPHVTLNQDSEHKSVIVSQGSEAQDVPNSSPSVITPDMQRSSSPTVKPTESSWQSSSSPVVKPTESSWQSSSSSVVKPSESSGQSSSSPTVKPIESSWQSSSSPTVKPTESSCNWRVPPKKRVDIDVDVRIDHAPKEPESLVEVYKVASKSHMTTDIQSEQGSKSHMTTDIQSEQKIHVMSDKESTDIGSDIKVLPEESTSKGKGTEEQGQERNEPLQESEKDDANTKHHHDTRVLKLKAIRSRSKGRQQTVRPHMCGICHVIIWGHSDRFRIHLKLHKKRRLQSRKRKESHVNMSVASRSSKRVASKKKVPGTVVKEEPKPTKPSGVKTSKASADENVRKGRKRKPAAKATSAPTKAPKGNVENDDDDVVSIPIPQDLSSLYLCGKCTVGFSDVMALVGHVAICTGAPEDTPAAPTAAPAAKSTSSNRRKKPGKKPDKSNEVSLSQSKPKIKTEGSKKKTVIKNESSKKKTVVKKEGSKSRSIKIKEIVNTSGTKPRIILRRVLVDNFSDDDVQDNDDDWVPPPQNDDDDDWKPAPKRLRIKKENVDHICEVCGASFSKAASLKRHSMKHLTGKHNCRFCPQSFGRSDQLKSHIKQDHPDAPDLKVTKTKGKIACPICEKTFSHHSAMSRHKMLHTGERRHVCEFCNVKFTQSCHMKQHIKKMHMCEGTSEYNCKICEQVFQSKFEYKTHMGQHAEENPYECEICKARFKLERTLEKHNTVVHNGNANSDASSTSCNECGKTFSFLSSLKRHRLVHAGIRKYECSRCNKRFSQRGHMKRHRCGDMTFRMRRKDNGGSNLCMLCGKSFCSASSMRQHELSVHAGSKDFKCPTCSKGFATSGHLNVHLSGAHGAGNHLCHQCGKSFSFKSSYLRHQKFHTGAKPYQCKYCERSFSQSSHCKAHEMTHQVTDRLECDFCGKRFKNPRNHKHHMKTHHGKNNTCNTFKCFRCETKCESKDDLSKHMLEKCYHNDTVCKTCSKTFPTNSHLVRHMRVHTQERPFQCHLCEKSFTQNAHLKSHVSRHGKIKPWQCEVCGRSYASRDYLKHHVKKVHEEQPDGTMLPEKKKKRTDCDICGKKYKSRKYLIVHQKKKHPGASILLKKLNEPLGSASSKDEPDDFHAQVQAQVVVPNVSNAADRLQNMVIYPQIPIPVEIISNSSNVGAPNTTTAGMTLQVQIPQTSAGVTLQGQAPPGGFPIPAELHPAKEQATVRKPEEGPGPNMIAESMRLITVNWW